MRASATTIDYSRYVCCSTIVHHDFTPQRSYQCSLNPSTVSSQTRSSNINQIFVRCRVCCISATPPNVSNASVTRHAFFHETPAYSRTRRLSHLLVWSPATLRFHVSATGQSPFTSSLAPCQRSDSRTS